MRRALVLIVVTAAVAVSFTNGTEARLRRSQTQVVPGSITVGVAGQTVIDVAGNITSESAKCLANRSVEVFAGSSSTLQSLFGRGSTDASGHFVVSGSTPDDSYFSIYVLQEIVGRTKCKSTAFFGQF